MTTTQAPEFRFYSTWHGEDHIEYLPMRLYPGPNDTLVAPVGTRTFRNREQAQAFLDDEAVKHDLPGQIAEMEAFLASDKVLPGQRETCEQALATLRGTTFQVFQRTVSAATPA